MQCPHWTRFAQLGNRTAMSKAPKQDKAPKNDREDRLKAALKANMAKRKAQARARAEQNNNKKG